MSDIPRTVRTLVQSGRPPPDRAQGNRMSSINLVVSTINNIFCEDHLSVVVVYLYVGIWRRRSVLRLIRLPLGCPVLCPYNQPCIILNFWIRHIDPADCYTRLYSSATIFTWISGERYRELRWWSDMSTRFPKSILFARFLTQWPHQKSTWREPWDLTQSAHVGQVGLRAQKCV